MERDSKGRYIKGCRHSQEEKDNLRIKSSGKRHTQEAKEKIRQYHLGRKHSKETLEKLSAAKTGKKGIKSNAYKNGRHLGNGYVLVLVGDHPRKSKNGYVYEHHLVMEKSIGRFLKDGEVVHHKDGNKMNNSIENLKLFPSQSEHMAYHVEQDKDWGVNKKYKL